MDKKEFEEIVKSYQENGGWYFLGSLFIILPSFLIYASINSISWFNQLLMMIPIAVFSFGVSFSYIGIMVSLYILIYILRN